MAQACSPGPAALLASLPAGPHTSANPELQSFWCPSCEICCANDAILFCRNDKAFLCALCDYKIHQNNPLAAHHEVVAVSDRTDAEGGLQKTPRADELVKVEFTTEPAVENRTITSDLSCISSTSGQGMLKCTANEALLDALNDPSVLELFPAGNLDGTIDEFQDVELDPNWIETLEKEGSRRNTPSPTTPMIMKREEQSDDEPLRPGVDQPQSSISTPSVPNFQSLQSAQHSLAAPIATIPQCPVPILPFLPMGAWDPMTTGFPFAPSVPPSLVPLQFPQSLLDRKARVARYREKRKHRTFENKIRYTSRKLYAENRPRIKGRFARPDELEAYLKEKEARRVQEDAQPPSRG